MEHDFDYYSKLFHMSCFLPQLFNECCSILFCTFPIWKMWLRIRLYVYTWPYEHIPLSLDKGNYTSVPPSVNALCPLWWPAPHFGTHCNRIWNVKVLSKLWRSHLPHLQGQHTAVPRLIVLLWSPTLLEVSVRWCISHISEQPLVSLRCDL